MTTTDQEPSLRIRAGHTMLLDEQLLQRGHCLSITDGLVRVGMSNPDQEALEAQPITLGFLQAGDHLDRKSTRLNSSHRT